MSDVQNYLNYLQSSLGLEHVILSAKKVRLHIQCVSEKPLTPQESEMFEKIITALKLPVSSYILSIVSQPVAYEASLVVLFTDDTESRGEWREDASARVLRTFSLSSMANDPALKKQCWAHLQTIPQ
jgi:hypothetical protein